MTLRTIVRSSASALAVVLAALAGGPVQAGSDGHGVEALADAGAANRVDVRVARGPDGIEVEGRCSLFASRDQAWAVLTDYDGIDRFVSSMRDSRVTARQDHEVFVDQVAVGGLLCFSHTLHVRLRVHEQPPGSIRFEDVSQRDFVSYRGEWRVEDHGDRVEITYRVAARPMFSVPDFLARGAFKHTVRELLTEVKVEIERRAALAGR